MTKASAIRQISRHDISKSNCQIKREVWAKFGLRVQSNQIIAIVGSEKLRRRNATVWRHKLDIAKDFLRKIGDRTQAIQLLRFVDGL